MTSPVVLVPVKALDLAKSRIDLPAERRREVARLLMEHTLRISIACVGADATMVVSSDPDVRAFARNLGASAVHDPHGELNPALAHGLRSAVQRWPYRATAVLVSDLPLLTLDGLRQVLLEVADSSGPRHVADLAGTGTTLVSVPPGHDLPMQFGPMSADRFRFVGCRPIEAAPFDVRADLDDLADLMELGLPTASAPVAECSPSRRLSDYLTPPAAGR